MVTHTYAYTDKYVIIIKDENLNLRVKGTWEELEGREKGLEIMLIQYSKEIFETTKKLKGSI